MDWGISCSRMLPACLTSVKSTGTNAVTATYANNNLTHMVTDGDGTFDYTYDSKHNLTTAKNAVVKERYNYDTGGNVTSSELTKADGTGVKIVGSTEYTYDKNRVQKTTAANGAETSYVYGSYTSLMYAIPTKVTNAAGTETWTTYNKDGSANLLLQLQIPYLTKYL